MTQPDSSTKPDQVEEAGRLEGKPKSSIQLHQNHRGAVWKKVKTQVAKKGWMQF